MADMCCSADNKGVLDEFSVFAALCKADIKGGETGYSPTGAHRGRRSTEIKALMRLIGLQRVRLAATNAFVPGSDTVAPIEKYTLPYMLGRPMIL